MNLLDIEVVYDKKKTTFLEIIESMFVIYTMTSHELIL